MYEWLTSVTFGFGVTLAGSWEGWVCVQCVVMNIPEYSVIIISTCLIYYLDTN